MRQVPKIILIGQGLASRHWSYYLASLHIDHHVFSRLEFSKKKPQADIYFLLIRDDGIVPFYQQYFSTLTQGTVIHCSGSQAIPGILGMHPLVSFGPAVFPTHFYKKIPLFVDFDFKKLCVEWPIFKTIKNPVTRISANEKPYYHAQCVLAGNFTSLLWKNFFAEFKKRYSINADLVMPYLESVYRNLTSHPGLAPSGPLVRKDLGTIKRNLKALEGKKSKAIYQSFWNVYR